MISCTLSQYTAAYYRTQYMFSLLHTYMHACVRECVRACMRTYIHTYTTARHDETADVNFPRTTKFTEIVPNATLFFRNIVLR